MILLPAVLAALVMAIVTGMPLRLAPLVDPVPTTQTDADGLMSIDKGTQSNVDNGRQVIVRTKAEWTALWQQHKPDRPEPAVDFSKQMVVGVFLGSRATAGFAVEIVSATTTGNGLVVHFRETTPGRGALTAQVITSPYHLVAVPKVAGGVTFEQQN